MSDAPAPAARPAWRAELIFWSSTFLHGVVILSLQRVLLFLLHAPDAAHGGTLGDAWPAFWRGPRFDGAALAYPFVLALLAGSLTRLARGRLAGARWDRVFVVAALVFVTFLAVVELFFFREFRTRLNFVALEYLDDPFSTVPLIFEFAGWWGSIVGLAAIALVGGAIARAVRSLHTMAFGTDDADRVSWVARGALLLALFVISRGGLGRPLRPQDAHPSPHRFVNQLSLSGPFTLGRHVYEMIKDAGTRADYGVAPSDALADARSLFAAPGDRFVDDAFPALRDPDISGEERHPNVIVIVLESFAARFVGALRAGTESSLTPELDALSEEGVFFTHFLATGPSTNRSLPAVMAGVPCLVKRTSIPKSALGQRELITIGSVLRERGYTTAFLRSGGPSWENLGGWLRSHGFSKLVNRDDLDRAQSVSSAGPPDHVLFERVFAVCEDLSRDGPFLAAMLTTTNHPPFALPDPLPEGVRARIAAVSENADAPRARAVLYADWAFGDFVRRARATAWGKEALFVVLGDHGVHFSPVADIDPDRRHVPLLLLGPYPELAPRRVTHVGSHVDVLPTLLGLLRLPVRHAAWGRDLLRPADGPRHAVLGPHGGLRAYAIARDDGAYLVDYLDGREELFDLDLATGAMNRRDDPQVAAALRKLGRAYLASAHHALDEGRAGPKPESE